MIRKLRFSCSEEQIDVMFDKELFVKNCSDLSLDVYETLLQNLTDYNSIYREVNFDESEWLNCSKEEVLENIYQNIVSIFRPIKQIESLFGDVFEMDKNSGVIYFKGIDEPIPNVLGDRILKLIETNQLDKFPYLVEFAKRCMENPDKIAREGLFGFLQHNGHPITKSGHFIAQKAVYKSEGASFTQDFIDFVNSEWQRRKDQKKSPSNYNVYNMDGEWMSTPMDVDSLICEGNLHNLKLTIESYSSDNDVYTDIHTRTFRIALGEAVTMNRDDCDSNPNSLCSRGLHAGSLEYVKDFGHTNRVILEVIIDPKDVVAVPTDYNNTKMRVCKYLPHRVYGQSDSNGNVVNIVDDREFSF